MCQSQREIYCFEDHERLRGKRFDALYIGKDDGIYCVEFKNSHYEEISKMQAELEGKFCDSFDFLKGLFEAKNLKMQDYDFYFYIVWKDSSKDHERFSVRKNQEEKGIYRRLRRCIDRWCEANKKLRIQLKTNSKYYFLKEYKDLCKECR